MRGRRAAGAVVLAVVATLALGGCGGGDRDLGEGEGEGGESAKSTAAVRAARAPTTVRRRWHLTKISASCARNVTTSGAWR